MFATTAHLPARRIDALNTETAPDRPLADKFSYPFAGVDGSSWSRAIADRYHLTLSAELADWFDSGICEMLGHGEFCEPATPEQLIGDAPECIWPGLMPPDVLPLVGNGLGDWLCGRVSSAGTIDEIIYWYHGGGDYLPYGSLLAQALLFDTVSEKLPGRRQLLAIPAERDSVDPHIQISGPMIAWALRQLPLAVASVLDIDAPPERVADALIRHRVALDAVRCDAVLAALDSEIRVRFTSSDAKALGVSWDQEVAKWMFDTSTIPTDVKTTLTQRWNAHGRDPFSQDWQAVERICGEMSKERKDLGWVYDCLGWSAQRRGDIQAAARHYEAAAMTSVYTDQTIRFRTHFDSHRIAKFSIARLVELGCEHNIDKQYVELLCHADMPNWQDEVTEYWLTKAAGPHISAADKYDFVYRAGWDVGCTSMRRYRELLQHLATAAMEAGQIARAEVARTHAACIADRMN